MYSPRIVARNVAAVEKKSGIKIHRYKYDESVERTEALNLAVDEKGTPKRNLSVEEQNFILNEQVMCQLDCKYFLERYWKVESDSSVGTGLCYMRLGAAQEVLFERIARAEEEEEDKLKRKEIPDGILIADHKARQVWHTALMSGITMHRLIFYTRQRGLKISVDDDKKMELYKRDRLIGWDSLPFFLRPALEFDVKNEHIQLGGTKSFINYMASNQKFSLGQSQQFDLGHLTELAEYENAYKIELDLLPSFGQSAKTLLVLESRANGRGNWWHSFSEDVRRGRKPRWRYCFIPYYAVMDAKYRRTPPTFWQPSDVSIMHAKKVYETSAEFVGKAIYLSKETLYWWETTREEYVKAGSLNFFLSIYCATPEESFQHSTQSAFSPEVLERVRLGAGKAVPYDVEFSV